MDLKPIILVVSAAIIGASMGMFYAVVVITTWKRRQRRKRFQNVKKYTKKANKQLAKMGKNPQEILDFHEAVLQEALIQVQLPDCQCAMEVASCETWCQFKAREVMVSTTEFRKNITVSPVIFQKTLEQ